MRFISFLWIITLLAFGLAAAYAHLTYIPEPATSKTTEEPRAETPSKSPAKAPAKAPKVSPSENARAEETPTPAKKEPQPDPIDTYKAPTNGPTPKPAAEPALAPYTKPLIASPDPELTMDSIHGLLPATVGGREPWRVYAHNKDLSETRPRIAIILTEAGLSERNTTNALNSLPNDVTFAFSPYAQNLPTWLDKARQAGHESLMMVPMEPVDYPKNNPGQHTLLTGLSAEQNLDRLHYVMSRGQGYVGIMNDMGSKYTANRDAMKTVINDLQKRGLLFLDGRTTRFSVAARMARDSGVPRAMNDRYIDNTIRPRDIDRYLNDLESVAQTYGSAVGIGRAYPITIGRIALWIETLAAKGIDLVPITAVVNRQPIR